MTNTGITPLLRLPPPDPAGSGHVRPLSAEFASATMRARVWMDAGAFFRREGAQAYCWLWLLAADGRVHAVRVPAERNGDEHYARSLLVRLATEPDAPIPDGRMCGPALPLPAAPIVPLPRWHVSWGHPLQRALRAFAGALDSDVLDALGALEVTGCFFGSVANYNRLATLPQPRRRHRLQALAEFPPLVAPLLLDAYGRPDMFGGDEDEPEEAALCRGAAGAAVLDAMDRGRDLAGALAAYYGIGRALVRSPVLREMWTQGCVPHEVLQLLEALPPRARPRTRQEAEDRLPLLRALPLQLRGIEDVTRLAGAFTNGWTPTWRALDGRAGSLETGLRDTRDFLRAALEDPVALPPPVALDPRRLGLAWIARRGLASLLDASLRWHAEPLRPVPLAADVDDSAGRLLAFWDTAGSAGEFAREDGSRARELLSAADLRREGETMHHCVGGYWDDCVLYGTRIVHLAMADGASATAEYALDGAPDDPTFRLEQLRGPCNADPSDAMRDLARAVASALNAAALRERRITAVTAAEDARAQQHLRTTPAPRRPLDRRSRHELRLVLAWCAKQMDWRMAAASLLRTAIRGFHHAEGPRLFPQLAPGDALELVREPDNPYDARAVRIDWRGHKLGYVPRGDNVDIARRLDGGEALAARIATLAQQASAWDAVEFEIIAA